MTNTDNKNDIQGFDEVEKSVKFPKIVKLLGFILLGLLVFIGLFGVIATQFIDQDYYKKLAVGKIAEKTGYTLDWQGDIVIGFIPKPHIAVDDLTIVDNDKTVFSVKLASLDIALIPLFSKKIQIENVNINDPVIDLTNIKAVKKTSPSLNNDEVKTTIEEKSFDVTLNQININNGTLISNKNKIENLDMRINAESISGPFDVAGQMQLMGRFINFKATSGKIDGKGSQIPVRLNIDVPESDISTNFSGSVDVTPVFKANGDVTVQLGKFSEFMPNIPKEIGDKFNLAGKLTVTDKEITLDNMILSLGVLSYNGMVSLALPNNDVKISLQSNSKQSVNNSPLMKLLSDLAVTGRGNFAPDKIKIDNSSFKSNGNNVDFSGLISTKDKTVTGFKTTIKIPDLNSPISASGNFEWNDDKYYLSELKGAFGKTTFAGDIVTTLNDKPYITGAINLGDIVVPNAVDKKPSSQVAVNNNVQSSGNSSRWNREVIHTAFLNEYNADLKISARSITKNLWILSNVNMDANLMDGKLNINDVSANMFGGRAVINGVINRGDFDASDVNYTDVKMSATNINANSLISAVMGAPSNTVTGTLDNVDIKISTYGVNEEDFINNLSGDGALSGHDLVVNGVDAAQLAMAAKGSYKPLERAGSFLGSFDGGQTEFDIFNSDFTIKNGIVNFNQILFDGEKATLNGTGNVNLPKWTIDLKNSMTVKNSDIPPFEFTIRGSLDNPSKAGGDLINNYLQKKFQKGVEKLLEKDLEQKANKVLQNLLGGH